MAAAAKARSRQRGSIKPLPSGSLRVRVYAGLDALTKERLYLTEVVPAGPKAAAEAERARTRLLNQVDERRNPKTRATVNQLLDRYLEVVDVEPTTRERYELDIRVRLRPILGDLPLTQLDPELVERLYAQLRRCRERCSGKARHVHHHTRKPHDCNDECTWVPCKPLSASSIRAMHWTLSAALQCGVRWRWISVNPLDAVEPPAPVKPKPNPPTLPQTVALLTEAWKDLDWGMLIWTATVTGARRSELCAVQRADLDLDAGVLRIQAAMKRDRGVLVRRDTKTHQHRRIALDPDTIELLQAHLARQDALAKDLDIEIGGDGYLFSPSPDATEPLKPDTATQRYERMASRLGIETTFHKLRHYNATELIRAGVDIRTVAGRLGHGGGGMTTLKFYAAFVSEADQRAASTFTFRLPKPGGDP